MTPIFPLLTHSDVVVCLGPGRGRDPQLGRGQRAESGGAGQQGQAGGQREQPDPGLLQAPARSVLQHVSRQAVPRHRHPQQPSRSGSDSQVTTFI